MYPEDDWNWDIYVSRLTQKINELRKEFNDITGHGNITFRLTQFLSGHGCFNKFLNRINRAPTSRCAHCTSNLDGDADHTLLSCRAWFWYRHELFNSLGIVPGEIDPPNLNRILSASLQGEIQWSALLSFAEKVMSAKEQAERDRQGIG